MDFTNRISQKLHEEHCATVALVERLEQLIARSRQGGPDVKDPTTAQLLGDLSVGIASEVDRHFSFEENHLFSYLAAIGDSAIGAHLTDEHSAIRPLGTRIASLARAAATQGFDAAGWETFRRASQEFCERMLTHIQKEEMALLPLISDTMDADTEARLYLEYVENA